MPNTYNGLLYQLETKLLLKYSLQYIQRVSNSLQYLQSIQNQTTTKNIVYSKCLQSAFDNTKRLRRQINSAFGSLKSAERRQNWLKKSAFSAKIIINRAEGAKIVINLAAEFLAYKYMVGFL